MVYQLTSGFVYYTIILIQTPAIILIETLAKRLLKQKERLLTTILLKMTCITCRNVYDKMLTIYGVSNILCVIKIHMF